MSEFLDHLDQDRTPGPLGALVRTSLAAAAVTYDDVDPQTALTHLQGADGRAGSPAGPDGRPTPE